MGNIWRTTLIAFIFILLIGSISAAEWDNKKYFDDKIGDYGKVTIGNWLGLGDKLIELELKENTESCFDCYRAWAWSCRCLRT